MKTPFEIIIGTLSSSQEKLKLVCYTLLWQGITSFQRLVIQWIKLKTHPVSLLAGRSWGRVKK
jgi:hypothetical protein